MDPLHQNIVAMAASWSEEDMARQLEHMMCIASYLRAFGAGIQVSVPTSEPAAILIAAAQIVEGYQELTNLALLRSAAVSEARRCMTVLTAKNHAEAKRNTLFTRAHWKILYTLAQAALTAVRKEESRRALVLVARLADRKTSAPRRRRPKQPPTLVVVGAHPVEGDIKTE